MSRDAIIQEFQIKYDEGRYRPKRCAHCKAASIFKEICSVSRQVRYWKDFRVVVKLIHVGVWLCSSCKRNFRHLPEFLLRYKRFMTDCLSGCCLQYLMDALVSTRWSAQHQGSKLRCYNTREEVFSHSTVWRWIKTWASMLDLLKAYYIKNGLPGIYLGAVDFATIPMWKYRDKSRLKLFKKSREYLYRCHKENNFS